MRSGMPADTPATHAGSAAPRLSPLAMPGVICKKFALCKHPLWLLPADLGKMLGYSITYPL